MSAASLIGFGVAFLLVCAATSALLAAVLHVSRDALARRGAAVERRAAELVAILPVVLGVAVVAILVTQSVFGFDHCDSHGDHAHLCLQHGAVWLGHASAIAALAVGVTVVLGRAAVLVTGLVRGYAHVARMRRIADRSISGARIVPSDRVFCFVAGIRRPTIFVSTGARNALDDDEWHGMLAHEASHVRHRDLASRLLLDCALLFAAPLVAIYIREHWHDATERLRDADAADAVGAPEPVASALVRMSRAAITARVGAIAAFTANGDRALATRVHALLEDAPRGDSYAARLRRRVLLASTLVVAILVVFAEPLHHALETLLG